MIETGKKILKLAIHLFAIAYLVFLVDVYILPLLSVHTQPKEITSEELSKFLKNRRVGSSPDYAVVKNGNDYLVLIYGYVDDYSTCMQMIEPFNKDPSLSVLPGTYQCVPMN